MDTIRVELDDLTFDISRGADGYVYVIVEGIGVLGEDRMSADKARELGKAFLDAAKVSM
jgi:hypothetical protein